VLPEAAVVGVVPAAVVIVVVVVPGTVVVVVVAAECLAGLVVVVVDLVALGVLDPQAAATKPPARTIVPTSQRFPLRLDVVSVSSGVTRVNTYCSSPSAVPDAARLKARRLRRRIPIEGS
jgi:hypothetical protein